MAEDKVAEVIAVEVTPDVASEAVEVTPDVASEAVEVTPDVASEEKQGSMFCGCCCDYRRAVIVLATVRIVEQLLILIGAFSGVLDVETMNADPADDGTVVSWVVLGIFFNIFQIFAAIKFNVCMLKTVIFFYLINFAIGVWATNQNSEDIASFIFSTGTVILCLYLYPVFGLISEINRGIMSAETYPREAKCCF